MDSTPVLIVIIQALLLAVITLIDIGQLNTMLLPESVPVFVIDVTEAVDLRHPVRLTLFINNMNVFYSYILF